jgi:hypothetical protein
MLNGYSGVMPASYGQHYESLRTFPSAESITALRAAGVTHIVVHRDRFDERAVNNLAVLDGVEQVAAADSIAVYRLLPKD